MTAQNDATDAEALQALIRAVADREVSLPEVLTLHPALIASLVERAIGLVEAGQFGRADALLRDLVRVDNVDPLIPFLLGGSRAKQNDALGAIQAFGEALDRCADTEDVVAQTIRLERAWSFSEIGRRDLALKDLEAATSGPDATVATEARSLIAKLGPRTDASD